jgi:aryl-alcohol dehydrogenase-like predicted oxidoreductase
MSATLSSRLRFLSVDLVLGTMYFGTRTDEATSFAMLDRYVEAGGRVLDTANCYSFWESSTGHGGQSEAVLGRWLAANAGVRDELVVATKVGQEPVDSGGVEGLSADVIAREAARSLDRLGVDAIDLYWAHGEDRSVPLAETVAAFGTLVASGVVRRLGVSNHPVWRVERARSLAAAQGVEPYSALQLTTSYVEPRPDAPVPGKDHRFGFVTDETLDYLSVHPGLELWVYSPLVQGSYDRADRPFPPAYEHLGTTARLAALAAVSSAREVAPSQVVLAWLLARGWKPIVGVSTLEQLDSALAAASLDLTPEELAALDAPR